MARNVQSPDSPSPSDPTASDPRATPVWGVGKLAAHHLLPGVASLIVFLSAMWVLSGSAVPAMVALFVAILVGEVPASWALMIRSQRSEGRPVSFAALFPWHESPGLKRLILIGAPLAIAGLIFVMGLASAAEPAIQAALFSWLPDWMVLRAGPESMAGASPGGLVLLWVLSGAVGVGVGGITQELYHRGFLLPRARQLGWFAVPFNAAFFAVFHLAAPWGWPFFFVAALLWAGAVYRWRSIQLGLAGHVGMLALGWIMMTGVVFGWVPMP